MAEKRMFAKTVIDSDAFLDMPQSSQLLYFHLAMRADDDGFINNFKSIMRIVKCNDDDLKILVSKKFIIPFESGVIVIKHWKIHNYIAKDRYHETKYKEEKESLFLDENNAYSQNEKEVYVECNDTSCKKEKKKAKKTVYYDDEKLNQAFVDFVDMRKKIKKPMTDRAVTLAMNKLSNLAFQPSLNCMDNELAIKILEQSTMSGYLGLFPLKKSDDKNDSNSPGGIDWNNV